MVRETRNDQHTTKQSAWDHQRGGIQKIFSRHHPTVGWRVFRWMLAWHCPVLYLHLLHSNMNLAVARINIIIYHFIIRLAAKQDCRPRQQQHTMWTTIWLTNAVRDHDLLSKLRLMLALLSPSSFLAVTLYLPASSAATFVISRVEK